MFTTAVLKNEEKNQMSKSQGTIRGKGDGKWGRITINRDGSLLLENVTLSDIKITNCDLHAESGEYPIPFADRMNILEDFASGDVYPEMTLGGRTHEQYRKDADAAYERYQQARAVILTKGQSND
jgi:hypothetical protein